MIDSHLHLDAPEYAEGGGVGDILRSAACQGVTRVITPSLHFDSFSQLERLADEHPNVYPAVGVHPHEVNRRDLDDLEARLEAGLHRLQHPILGETGLEGHYQFTDFDRQLTSLRAHLRVAQAHGVPCILHCRSCESELEQELQNARLRYPVVVHCFTGTWEWAQRFLDLGCYLGITGIVTFKKPGSVAEVASRIPLDRLLVETDGPYLAPLPHRGRLNKPEYIPLIVEAIAQYRGCHSDEIALATVKNTERLFRLPSDPVVGQHQL